MVIVIVIVIVVVIMVGGFIANKGKKVKGIKQKTPSPSSGTRPNLPPMNPTGYKKNEPSPTPAPPAPGIGPSAAQGNGADPSAAQGNGADPATQTPAAESAPQTPPAQEQEQENEERNLVPYYRDIPKKFSQEDLLPSPNNQ